MMPLLAVLLTAIEVGVGPAAAVPPPPDQVAARCDAPTYASDMLVCADPALLTLDRRMRDAWAAIDAGAAIAPLALLEPQQAWFMRRSRCAFAEGHAGCLRAAYGERIAVLDALVAAASRPRNAGQRASCRDAPWGTAAVRVVAVGTQALRVDDAGANVLAVATSTLPSGNWTPFVAFDVQGATIRLTPMSAPTIVCSLGKRS